jgi:hypothetical protein
MDPAAIAALAGETAKVGPEVFKTLLSIKDDKQRQKFEQSLALLSSKQQQELNDKLLNATTQTEKLKILSGSLVQYALANENSAANRETVMYIIAGTLAVVLLTVTVIIVVKTKKQ